MCLGIACEVVEVEGREACLLRVGSGVQRCFSGLVEPLAPGDWVLMHAGFAVQRISVEEARANLELVRQAARLQDEAIRAEREARPVEGGPVAGATAGDGAARHGLTREREDGA